MTRFSMVAFLFLVACGGGGTTKSDDPRCETLCANRDQTDGYGYECTSQSVEDCKTQCGAKIYGVSTVCGNCLLEDAELSHGGYTSCGGSGGNLTCTLYGDTDTTCTYTQGNSAELKACYEQLYPSKKMSCDVEFHHDLDDCKDYCTSP